MTRICKTCKKEFKKPYNISKKSWKTTKFCSHKCYCISIKGIRHKNWNGFKKGHTLGLGKKRPNLTGEKHPAWKGDKAKIIAIHQWVKRHKGIPKKCVDCGKEGNDNGHKIHWSNVDHKYRRILSDYVARCNPCHIKYDKTLR